LSDQPGWAGFYRPVGVGGEERVAEPPGIGVGLEEAFEVAGVEAWQVVEASIGAEAAIGEENMDMRVEVEQLAGGLEETHSAGCQLSAVEGHLEVEPEGSPGTSGELTQKLAVVA